MRETQLQEVHHPPVCRIEIFDSEQAEKKLREKS